MHMFIKIIQDYLTDSGMTKGRKIANSAGPYTILRRIRQDFNKLAINPSKTSPTANVLDIITLPKTLFFTPMVSIPKANKCMA